MQRWLWGTGCALVAAGCLDAPPGSTSPDGPPCDVAPPGCALFTCDELPFCYLFCAAETSLAEAVELCATQPVSKVLETETLEELACAQAHNVSSIWIGLVQDDPAVAVDAGWTWLSTEEAPAETFWNEIEPNDDPTDGEDSEEQCAIMLPTTGEWADVPCSSALASVVCELTAE